MAEQVTVKIRPDGTSTVRVDCGAEGPACKALTHDLERALGKVTQDTPTPAMFSQQGVKVTQ